MPAALTAKRLLESGLYTRDKRRLVSRFYPPFNIVPVRTERQTRQATPRSRARPGLPRRILHIDQRPLKMVTGEPTDLRLEDEPHFGRIVEGHDLGMIYRGLRQHLLLPRQRVWVIDEHHLLYYLLWEARSLGLFRSPPLLVNFDAHHDAAALALDPPRLADLEAQADFVMRHVRIGNHVTALLRCGLARRVLWVTHRKELAYRRRDMDQQLAVAPGVFDVAHLEDLEDGRLATEGEPLVVSLDWDFLTARYNGGLMLETVARDDVEDFRRQWRRLGLRLERMACLVIATSPGYAEEESTLAGVQQFLAELA